MELKNLFNEGFEDFTEFGQRNPHVSNYQNNTIVATICTIAGKGNYNIALNPEVAEYVESNGLIKVKVRHDKYTDEWYFIFNREEGLDIRKRCEGERIIYITNKEFAYFVVQYCCGLDVEENKRNKFVITISENLAKKNDFATYRIIKKS